MRNLIIPAIAALIVVAASCNSDKLYGNQWGACAGGTNIVAVCDEYYHLDNLAITSGTTVTWKWEGRFKHSVTFDSGPVVPTGSPSQFTGSFQTTFNTKGVYTYHCDVFTGMKGTIHVN
jgi:plastocyanin